MKAYSFYSFSALLLTTILILLGIGMVVISYQPVLFNNLVELLAKGYNLKVIGIASLTLGLLLLTCYYLFSYKSYYQFRIGDGLKFSTKKSIIFDYLQNFFKAEVPNYKIAFVLHLKRNTWEIIANMKEIPLSEHEELLEKIEPKLIEKLKSLTGAPKKILFSVLCQKL